MSPRTTAAGLDGDAILGRAKRNRAVRRPDAHLAVAEPVDLDTVPAPYLPRDADELDEQERADLATCERAMVGLQKAFMVAGKALATINQARLYRETHATFANYVEDRWGIQRAYAYRLIQAWPVAIALSPQGDIPEKHVRALMPAVKHHGIPVAKVVYEELGQGGERVTTARVQAAVRVLPRRSLSDPDRARYMIRQADREGRIPRPGSRPAEADQADDGGPPEPEPITQLRRLIELQQTVYDRAYEVIPAAMAADPGTGEELMRQLRGMASRTVHRSHSFGEPAVHKAEPS